MFFQKIACIINIMDINYNSDVIVIGAGPCGIAAALEVARGGKKVVLIEKGEHTRTINIDQQLDECTVVIRSEDFRGYIARQEIFPNVKSYPTQKLENPEIIPASGFSYESSAAGEMTGVRYLTDGDCKGMLEFKNKTSTMTPYY